MYIGVSTEYTMRPLYFIEGLHLYTYIVSLGGDDTIAPLVEKDDSRKPKQHNLSRYLRITSHGLSKYVHSGVKEISYTIKILKPFYSFF